MNGEVFSTDINPGDMVKLVKKIGTTVFQTWDANQPIVEAVHAVRGDWALVIEVQAEALYILCKGRVGWVYRGNWLRML